MRAWWARLRTNQPALALVALATPVGLIDVGSLLGVWGWLPMHLHSAAASTCAALTVVVYLSHSRQVAAVERAYRLGLRHGGREHRRKCEARCGHTCGAGDATGEIPAVRLPVVAGGNVVRLPEQRRGVHRRRAGA